MNEMYSHEKNKTGVATGKVEEDAEAKNLLEAQQAK